MDWFHPSIASITDLSLTCISFVFLVYLLTLKSKTRDCYLLVFIYLSVFIYLLYEFFLESMVEITSNALLVSGITITFSAISILWCSYRFCKNIYPRESLIVSALFVILFGLSVFFYVNDFQLYHRISRSHISFRMIINIALTFLSAINYLRKIKFFSDEQGFFPLIKDIVHPSTKVISLLRDFAISLFMYATLYLLYFLEFLNLLNPTFNWYLTYLLTISITTLVAFSYFSYASEQTSFETKLVGVTLFITLGILGMIPLTLFGPVETAETYKYIKAFVWIIPLSTLLISLVLPLLFRLTALKPLNKIVNSVQAVISGDLTASIDIEINDEIGRLSQNFNIMTESLRQRTEQLNSMRETIAADFHDQTGNMLSAITRQASFLQLKLKQEDEIQPALESIIKNSNSLHASSKDFLWNLNHNSDDPAQLFDYLTGYGQLYYNQFDIAFSSAADECLPAQFNPFAALNLIFILKEAMTNVVKHAGANEVKLSLKCSINKVTYLLEDNGSWKSADNTREHYGLTNMERRCTKNNFEFALLKQTAGTQISITVPVQQMNGLQTSLS